MISPLVSILIPAHNSEEWVADSIRSAIAQTWQRKEIIIVDDGSSDKTGQIARQFCSKEVTVVSTDKCGAAAARNEALRLSNGDYIQWLDADDLLSPDKIERQLAVVWETDGSRVLLSSPWGYFNYRTDRARFVPTSLWHDLSPVEWLFRKMNENLFMQTATWLTSRELTEAAGPWDTRLISDDDGEYFCRVLLASEGTRFVPDAKIFYRITPGSRLSYIGNSDEKKDSLYFSLELHVRYLLSLEDSARTRNACLTYLQTWFDVFYPDVPDLIAKLQKLAAELQGHLEVPKLRRKYAWIRPIFGWNAAKQVQMALPQVKTSLVRYWDKAMYRLMDRGRIA
jgi:glycosyltransferase involved in cell wall biosynthesis